MIFNQPERIYKIVYVHAITFEGGKKWAHSAGDRDFKDFSLAASHAKMLKGSNPKMEYAVLEVTETLLNPK